jgi:hypothetical protein
MRKVDSRAGWDHINTLFETGSLVGLTDRQLVDRFLAGEAAEAAFEALVERWKIARPSDPDPLANSSRFGLASRPCSSGGERGRAQHPGLAPCA